MMHTIVPNDRCKAKCDSHRSIPDVRCCTLPCSVMSAANLLLISLYASAPMKTKSNSTELGQSHPTTTAVLPPTSRMKRTNDAPQKVKTSAPNK